MPTPRAVADKMRGAFEKEMEVAIMWKMFRTVVLILIILSGTAEGVYAAGINIGGSGSGTDSRLPTPTVSNTALGSTDGSAMSWLTAAQFNSLLGIPAISFTPGTGDVFKYNAGTSPHQWDKAFTVGTLTNGMVGTYTSSGTLVSFNTPMGAGMVEKAPIAIFDTGASAITTSAKPYYTYMPYAGTITQWTVICQGGSGAETTFAVDIARLTYTAGTLPTDSIVGGGNKPTASNYESQAAPSSWTSTSIAARDVLKFTVTANATQATWCGVFLDVTR